MARYSLDARQANAKVVAFEKMNADLARTLENKKRSAVRKPDWR